jgi:uncharacterized protein (TIGR02099 family)
MVWGGLHFLIVPRIGEWRPWLEQQASNALGVQVRIGVLTAQSNGLIPSFELREVTLLDTQGREALRLPVVLAALSPRSALAAGFEQLYIDGAAIDVRRATDGKIWVAGFALPDTQSPDGNAADWVFSQTELALRHGTVTWTDEMRAAPPLVMSDVDVVLRNRGRSHQMRADVTPPAAWGARLSASAVMTQALLTRRAGQWKAWTGQLYAELPGIDLSQLRRYADVGVDVSQGAGQVRAWVDVAQGEVTGVTSDLALQQVNVRVNPKLEPLSLQHITGRMGIRRVEGGTEFSTESLQFETHDGLRWPGGNFRVGIYPGDDKNPARGDLAADRLDLEAMAQIAGRLPLDDAAHAALMRYDPKGLVEKLEGNWQGPFDAPTRYVAKGRITGMEMAAQSSEGRNTPGFKGLDLDFDANQASGKANVAMHSGSVDLPGIFDDAHVRLDDLAGAVQWTLEGPRTQVSASGVRFANADAQGELQFKWQTDAVGNAPGILDLQGTLSRAEGARVYRYLPLVLDKEVRDYVQGAMLGGTASNVKFKVKGDLKNFPFADPKQGDFSVSASVRDATYAYVPAALLPKDSLPWPALTQLSADFSIDRDLLQIKGARAALAGAPGLQISKGEATITKLYHDAQLAVAIDAKGPLPELLGMVNTSPLAAMTGKILARTVASGSADYRIKLGLPLANVDKVTLQGSVTLAGNDLQLSPDTPRLARARGVVGFTESGFSITGGQARALGGDIKLDGSLSLAAAPLGPITPVGKTSGVLRLSGNFTAEGLRQAKELGVASRLAQYASGGTSFVATLGMRGGVPEFLVSSNLSGLALTLPAPFAKSAEALLPVRLETTALRSSPVPGAGLVRGQDQLQIDLGRLASAVFQRDVSGPEPRVLRGAIGVGLAADESAPLPSDGVVANISMGRVDLDAWGQVFNKVSGTTLSPSVLTSSTAVPGVSYLPTSMAVRAQELVFGGRKINRVVVGGGREGLLWRANLDATELSGYVEYRQPAGANAGRLYARLARLALGQSTAQDVENLLDEQPASIPALDVVVEDLELRGKKFGRVEMDAVNLGSNASGAARDATREWRLNRLNIVTSEASLTASGNWTNINATAPSKGSIKERRRTVMNFKLDIADAGDLLQRFGMPGVVRRGKGKIDGQVAWMGSPISLDYPSLSGNINVNVETGQFLKADPGIAKLFGVLSLQSLPRRLALDFRDVFSEGFAFDFFRGDVAIERGIARTNNLQMKGVNAAVLMEGQADIAKETQSIKVVVVPEINAGSASLLASTINPLIGLTTFLAQLVLRKPLIEANTQEFFVDGTWLEPRVTRVERK